MVIPDLPETQSRVRRRVGMPWILGSIIVVAGAVIALMAMTTPPPVAEPPASTSTTFVQPSTTLAFTPQGEPLVWESLGTLRGLHPVGIFEVDGVSVVFATNINTGSLYMITFPEGGTTEATLIEGAFINSVTRWGDRWLGVGSDRDTSSITVWNSHDGSVWQPTTLDAEEIAPGYMAFPRAHVTDNLAVIFANVWGSSGGADLADADEVIAERYGDGVVWFQNTDHLGALRFNISGPLGIFLEEVSATDLGFDWPEADIESTSEEHLIIWASTDGVNWERGSLSPDYFYLNDVFTGPDGRIWATFYAETGLTVVASSDGVEWEDLGALVQSAYAISEWPNGYVATGHGYGDLSVLTSPDALTWDPLPFGQFLAPATRGPWSFHGIGSPDHGVAVVAHLGSRTWAQVESQPTVYEANGFKLTVSDASLTFTHPALDPVWIQRSVSSRSPSVRVEPGASAITFIHPTTGEEMMTLTFEQLNDLEPVPNPGVIVGGETTQVFLFTPDGVDWIVHDFSSVVPPLADLGGLVFAGDSLYAILFVGQQWTEGAMLLKAQLRPWLSSAPSDGG